MSGGDSGCFCSVSAADDVLEVTLSSTVVGCMSAGVDESTACGAATSCESAGSLSMSMVHQCNEDEVEERDRQSVHQWSVRQATAEGIADVHEAALMDHLSTPRCDRPLLVAVVRSCAVSSTVVSGDTLRAAESFSHLETTERKGDRS